MTRLFQRLLLLYPAMYRHEFAEEMLACFGEAHVASRQRGGIALAAFCSREIYGILSGAVEERLRSLLGGPAGEGFGSRSLRMRSSFRYPVASILLMLVTFGLVITAIESANRLLRQNAIPYQMPLFQWFVMTFGVTLVATVGVIAVRHALRRSGAQRLEDVQTWPAPK